MTFPSNLQKDDDNLHFVSRSNKGRQNVCFVSTPSCIRNGKIYLLYMFRYLKKIPMQVCMTQPLFLFGISPQIIFSFPYSLSNYNFDLVSYLHLDRGTDSLYLDKINSYSFELKLST